MIARLVQRIVRGDTSRLTTERLVLARFLTLALEFPFSLTREIANERKRDLSRGGGTKV